MYVRTREMEAARFLLVVTNDDSNGEELAESLRFAQHEGEALHILWPAGSHHDGRGSGRLAEPSQGLLLSAHILGFGC